ncbi:glutamine--fructose-6-phosphate transaminase (isomerizing) [Kineococcus aurantiacus]|uniref:Glutamine--fructose-6-phosphate aminotransferase [isomerizing] n=1 Tax=Kineococcus aurantiacus TaxID=37633 RepID=A0A7Y9DLN3_9ACTN|nr:glutamine--fructose-6-phosphate transaminase (isomerizing) [Kineococcus aurantiacus]NYD22909.1 glucosamine--fructose-6-phosphate aminotransferase (isomerizing) [Kineococcus aurantiacus]
MCGILAGRRTRDLVDVVLSGLRALEYRGYDSAGVAVLTPGSELVDRRRSTGRLADLEFRLLADPLPPGAVLGIGHTRWATHGGISEGNAHPHCDCTGRVAVVHNGIVTNAAEIASLLVTRGHRLTSGVDSEVVAHLVKEELDLGWDLAAAVRITTRRLEGSWALAVLAAGHDSVVLTARNSPLVVGTGQEGNAAASDPVALVGTCEEVSFLDDDDLVELGEDVRWFDHHDLAVQRATTRLRWRPEQTGTGAHADRTAREIDEQADHAAELVRTWVPSVRSGRVWDQLALPVPERVRFLACGSSRHAAEVGARVLRRLAGTPCEVTVASEHDPADQVPGELTVAVSQSGETADVLRALDALPGPLLAVTNSPTSSLARRADAVFDLGVGPELGVAATKTFTAQVLAGVFLALSSAVARGRLPRSSTAELLDELSATPEALHRAGRLALHRADELAERLAPQPGFLFVARGAALPYAAEGALKLEELTYRWAQCHPAGEFKHGPLALVEPGTPVVVVEDGAAALDTIVHEVSARGADVLRVGWGEGCAFGVLDRPEPHAWGPLESIAALQHLARTLAARLGRDVDRPRNLAKSVTVV